MHHIITDVATIEIPANELAAVFKLIKHLKERGIEFTHHFEE